MKRLLIVLGLLSCSESSGTATPEDGAPVETAAVRLELVATGLDSPVFLTAPANDPRLFVVEQEGRIRLIRDGRLQGPPFLDITDRVGSGGERGLLSVAFHPDYATNGFLYVNYTDRSGDTRIERYHAAPSSDAADPASGKLLLTIDQPYSNHNGGLVMFGPDRMLYIGMGDGGSGGDPQGFGQNPTARLGKILRIDVDRGDPYAIPANNPYATTGGAREIWAIGVRNPWRFSFDGPTGLFIMADVGQNEWEEIHAAPASTPGINYGWNIMEGTHCFRSSGCSRTGLNVPIHEYNHSDGCSITGGYVYRGPAMPSLAGTYFYSDYCQGWLKSFRIADGRATGHQTWDVAKIGSVSSFGLDSAGELYMLSANGGIYRLAPS
jgi:glucose/arabinose dehydrogenase